MVGGAGLDGSARWTGCDCEGGCVRERGTYQSWNWARGSESLGCIVTYNMPGVDLDAMVGLV